MKTIQTNHYFAFVLCLTLSILFFSLNVFSQVCALGNISNCTGNGCQYRYTADGQSSNPHQVISIPMSIDLGDLPDSCYTGAGAQISITGMDANGPIYDIPSPLVLFVVGTQPRNANIAANCQNTFHDPAIVNLNTQSLVPGPENTNTACTVVNFDMATLMRLPSSDIGMSATIPAVTIQYKRWMVAAPPYCVNTIYEAELIAGGTAPALARSTAEIGPNVTVNNFSIRYPTPPQTCTASLVSATCNSNMNGQFIPPFDLGNSTTCKNGCVVSGALNVPVGANTYYSEQTPVGNCAGVSQVRNCSPGDSATTLGTMDGNVANQYLTCTPGCGTIDGVQMRHGDSRSFWTEASSFDCASKEETRTCNNGSMDVIGTANHAACVNAPLNPGDCGVLYKINGMASKVDDMTITAGTSWNPPGGSVIVNYGGSVINGPNLDCRLCAPASSSNAGCPVIANGSSSKTCAGNGMSYGACSSSCDVGYFQTGGAQPNITCGSGICGSADNDPASRIAPILNLCSSGAPSAVVGNAGQWEWTCGGAVACNQPRIYIVGQTNFADGYNAIYNAGTCCATAQVTLHTGGPPNGQYGQKCIDLAGVVTNPGGMSMNTTNAAMDGAFTLIRWSDGVCEGPNPPVVCGTAAGTTVGAKPVANLCSDGSTPAVNFWGSWHGTRYWNWNCGGNSCFADTNLTWNYCFVGGTKVTMADGSQKNIESIEVGEKVLTYDEVSKQQVIRPVSETIHHESRWTDLYSFEFSDGSKVTSNGEHRFFIADREIYLSAEQIYKKWSNQESVVMLNSQRNFVDVKNITVDYQNVPLYNLHIDGLYDQDDDDLYTKSNHNYFAGNILAHNVKWCGGQSVGNDISNMAQACEGANDGCNPILNVMECKFGTVAEKNAFCTCMDTAYAASGSACPDPSCASAYVPTCQAETKTWGGNCSANIPATTENTNTAAIANTAPGFTGSAQFRCEPGATAFTLQAGSTCNVGGPVACGTAHGGAATFVPPTANLCSDASTPAVTRNAADFTWTCGVATACSVNKATLGLNRDKDWEVYCREIDNEVRFNTKQPIMQIVNLTEFGQYPCSAAAGTHMVAPTFPYAEMDYCDATTPGLPDNLYRCDIPQSHYYGGNGGSPFDLRCPGDIPMVGYDGRGGAAVDGLRFHCQDTSQTAYTGGGGGGPVSSTCPAGKYITQIHLITGWDDINYFYPSCGDINGGGYVNLTPVGQNSGFEFTYTCAAGTYVSRVEGRSGAVIDGLKVYCKPF